MSYYGQQPPVGVPPQQGYPGKDGYPPAGYPPAGYPPPAQGYPPQGYPPQYAQLLPPGRLLLRVRGADRRIRHGDK
uniref:Rhodopsin n=1 Tax=Zea mays TaxID=4577 RepID=B4FLL6_MAIZE|nr:unknown [Zea mays]